MMKRMKLPLILLGILLIGVVYSFKITPYQIQPPSAESLPKPTPQPTRTDEEMRVAECFLAESHIKNELDADCAEFPDQKLAQMFYECSIELAGYDIFHLDRDRDGVACELLP